MFTFIQTIPVGGASGSTEDVAVDIVHIVPRYGHRVCNGIIHS